MNTLTTTIFTKKSKENQKRSRKKSLTATITNTKKSNIIKRERKNPDDPSPKRSKNLKKIFLPHQPKCFTA